MTSNFMFKNNIIAVFFFFWFIEKGGGNIIFSPFGSMQRILFVARKMS